MRKTLGALFSSQQAGIVLVIVVLGFLLAGFSGTHADRATGHLVNNFLNPSTVVQIATDASFFAIMAVGMTLVIVSGGIDLSVGSIYSLSGVAMALYLRSHPPTPLNLAMGAVVCCAVGLLAGLVNGFMIRGLGVHPFIVTLGTMWIFRGLAFVTTKAESILVPHQLTDIAKATLGLPSDLYPVPMILMLLVTFLGSIYLQRTVRGRQIFAVGGNVDASRYSGLPLNRILVGVYAISGLTAGVSALLGSSYYGAASSADGTGYELYVIASAVVGGASLVGGRGTAWGALFGTLLIVLIRQSITTLRLDQNYEWIIIGVAIIIAVVLDRLNARLSARRLLEARK